MEKNKNTVELNFNDNNKEFKVEIIYYNVV